MIEVWACFQECFIIAICCERFAVIFEWNKWYLQSLYWVNTITHSYMTTKQMKWIKQLIANDFSPILFDYRMIESLLKHNLTDNALHTLYSNYKLTTANQERVEWSENEMSLKPLFRYGNGHIICHYIKHILENEWNHKRVQLTDFKEIEV